MNRLATVTVIRGNGACEAYVNGVIQEEIVKMKERHERELVTMESELAAAKSHRNDLLGEKLAVVRAANAKSISWFERVKERIIITWCQIWGMGEAFKLWFYEGE